MRTCHSISKHSLTPTPFAPTASKEKTYIQRLNPLVKPLLHTLSHQTTSAHAAKVMQHPLFPKTILFYYIAVQTAVGFEFNTAVLHIYVK